MKIISCKIKYFVLLIVGLLFYSFTSIFSKLASYENFLSIKYLLFYSLIVFFLFIYAIIWQQVLRHIDLSIAMSFKPLVLIFNFIWSIFLFNEKITTNVFIGFIVIFIGIMILVNNSNNTNNGNKDE